MSPDDPLEKYLETLPEPQTFREKMICWLSNLIDDVHIMLFKMRNGWRDRMTTDELIKLLRICAEGNYLAASPKLVGLAADRLEELDERVDILQESLDAEWGNNYG